MSYRILVLEGITDRGRAVLEAEGWTVDLQKAMPSAEIATIIPPYDAVLIRSASKINAEVLNAATNLKVVGRSGVGVDNVDLETATRRGIMVMNSPVGNMVSTAELAMALMLAVARNVAAGDASMKQEKWDKKSLVGTELNGKRLGIVGLGRIGREVASRARAFGMDVIAFDPFVSPAIAEANQIRLGTMDEVLSSADYLSLHATLSKETRHLIGKEALGKAKPGIRIINAARGELIDDEALLAALDSGRVAGAGLDVHAKEPPTDWRLAKHPKVVALPHLGASTVEAQEKVGTDIALQVRDFLKGGIIQQSVNFFCLSGELFDRIKPAMTLAERLGLFLGHACSGTLERLEVGVYGDLQEFDIKVLLSSAVTGLLRTRMPSGVTMVNARSVAAEQGIAVVESTSSTPTTYPNLIAMRLKTSDEELSIAGTVFSGGHLRLVNVDGVEVDTIPHGNILLVKNDDTPGIVGQIGTALGKRKVNIARMGLGRKPGSGRAIMLIEVDSTLTPEVVAELPSIPGIREARFVELG